MSEINGVAHRVVRAVNGDRLAMGELFAEHYEALARHLLPRIPESRRGEIGADDLIQESFVHAMRSIQHLEIRTSEGFKAWLIRIVDNELQNRLRSIHRVKRGSGAQVAHLQDFTVNVLRADGAPADETPSGGERRREAASQVQSKVSDLPPEQRDAVRLHYLGNSSIAATGQAMKKSPGAIRGLLQRARMALRKSLDSFSTGDR